MRESNQPIYNFLAIVSESKDSVEVYGVIGNTLNSLAYYTIEEVPTNLSLNDFIEMQYIAPEINLQLKNHKDYDVEQLDTKILYKS